MPEAARSGLPLEILSLKRPSRMKRAGAACWRTPHDGGGWGLWEQRLPLVLPTSAPAAVGCAGCCADPPMVWADRLHGAMSAWLTLRRRLPKVSIT